MSTEALLKADFVLSPFDHQTAEFEYHCDDPKRALGWTMRTGKSKAVIDKCSHLYLTGKIDGVLIFAPNGVHANWVEVELPKHLWPQIKWDGIAWRSSELSRKQEKHQTKLDVALWRRHRVQWYDRLKKAQFTNDLMVLACNSESMTREDVRRVVAYFIRKRKRVAVIFDESSDFGTPGSKRTKMARSLVPLCAYRMILDGTMVVSSPLQAWSQFELLEKSALGFDTYKDFKYHFAEYAVEQTQKGRRYERLVGFRNLDELRDRMSKYMSVVLREDCLDMPDVVIEPRKVTPTEEQRRIYRDLHHQFWVDFNEERVSIGEIPSKLQKLQQVFSGFLIDDEKRVHHIPGANPRLDLLSHEFYIAPGKVIVWCQFQEDMNLVRARLEDDGHEVVEYHGRVPDQAKAKALHRFRTDKGVKGLIGHMKSGGRGQDMSIASRIFVYSHTFSARARAQAIERATKIGGRNILLLDFIAPGPDPYILKVTNDRLNVADYVAGTGMKQLLRSIKL